MFTQRLQAYRSSSKGSKMPKKSSYGGFKSGKAYKKSYGKSSGSGYRPKYKPQNSSKSFGSTAQVTQVLKMSLKDLA
jgi:hypothetical protein